MKKVIIAGGGAAGMMAGIMLAKKGYQPVIYEKNDRLGKKLFITGKGRCNLTNNCATEELFRNVVTNPKFLYSAFNNFNSGDAMQFFEELGLKQKTERGNRVFPVSDHSSDVISVLSTALKRLNVEIRLGTKVSGILCSESSDGTVVSGIEYNDQSGRKKTDEADYVVVATGGMSYQATGSTGDGIKMAESLGIDCRESLPSLVPLEVKEDFCHDLMGLALKNVEVSFEAEVKNKKKIIYSDFGEMLFTHFGVSGPVVLSASAFLHKYYESGIAMYIDLKPALTTEQLDERILRDFNGEMNKQFRNSLNDLLPKRLIPIVIEMSGIDQYKKVNEISREERLRLVNTLKGLRLTIKGPRGFEEAIITKGGVSVKEINPKTMESKKIKGLHFIGEVLDVDALTGGFNLQIAWSTAAALE